MNARPSIRDTSMNPATTRTPTAIARSSPDPVLRPSHGARLIVIRWLGQSKPELASAARARSRASRIDSSGRPTMCRPGSPLPRCTSTWTAWPRAPRALQTERKRTSPLHGYAARVEAPQRTSRRGDRASRTAEPPKPTRTVDPTEGVSQSTCDRFGSSPCHTLGRAWSPRIRSTSSAGGHAWGTRSRGACDGHSRGMRRRRRRQRRAVLRRDRRPQGRTDDPDLQFSDDIAPCSICTARSATWRRCRSRRNGTNWWPPTRRPTRSSSAMPSRSRWPCPRSIRPRPQRPRSTRGSRPTVRSTSDPWSTLVPHGP